MFGKKTKSNKVDLGAAQFLALRTYTQLVEVMSTVGTVGWEVVASLEPEFSVGEPDSFGDCLEEAVFVFPGRHEHHIHLSRTLYKHGSRSSWSVRRADVLSDYFKATAQFGSCKVLGVPGVQIELEYTNRIIDGSKNWYIEGNSTSYRLRVTPEQLQQIQHVHGLTLRERLKEMRQLGSIAWRMFD